MTTAGVVLVVPGVVEDDGVEEDEVRAVSYTHLTLPTN